jgi:tol-pal system protein YbgF
MARLWTLRARTLVGLTLAAAVSGCGSVPLAPQTAPSKPANPPQAVETPVEVLVQLQEIRAEIKSLRNELEIQGHQMDSLQRRQRELYDDLDRRLRERERAQAQVEPGAMPGATPGSTMGPADTMSGAVDATGPLEQPAGAAQGQGDGAAAATTAEPSAEERTEYETAFNFLKQSRYGAAIAAFRTFLDRYPGSAYAPDAQYWIAEAHYVTRDFGTALEEYTKLVDNYPQSRKLPEAMLKMGYCQIELGNTPKGRELLNEVILRFPGTRVAISAENRLRKLSP